MLLLAKLKEPKEFHTLKSGTFIISKFPALAGRKIMFTYPLANTIKLVEYVQSEDIAAELLQYTEHVTDHGNIRIENKVLIDQHLDNWYDMVSVEIATLYYNFDFLGDGNLLSFWKTLTGGLEDKTIKILTRFVATLSEKGLRPLESSKKSTHSKNHSGFLKR